MRNDSRTKRGALERGECAWTTDEDGVFYTRCGEAFVFLDAGPKENGMKWCCYCGGTLKYEDDAP